jgi:hypothetical protein
LKDRFISHPKIGKPLSRDRIVGGNLDLCYWHYKIEDLACKQRGINIRVAASGENQPFNEQIGWDSAKLHPSLAYRVIEKYRNRTL